MRSAISGLYCRGNRLILPAVGTAEDHRLPSFATVRSLGGELGDGLRGSEQDEAKPVTAVSCPQVLSALNPVQDLAFGPFDGRSVRVYRTISVAAGADRSHLCVTQSGYPYHNRDRRAEKGAAGLRTTCSGQSCRGVSGR